MRTELDSLAQLLVLETFRLERNLPVDGLDARHASSLLHLLAGSTTNVVDIHLVRNAVGEVNVNNGILNLTESTFEDNSEGPTARWDLSGRARIAKCASRGREDEFVIVTFLLFKIALHSNIMRDYHKDHPFIELVIIVFIVVRQRDSDWDC